jgi:hypothetical protein
VAYVRFAADSSDVEVALASSWQTARMIAAFSLTRSLIRAQSTMISLLAVADSDGARSTGPLHAASATASPCVGHGRLTPFEPVRDVDAELLTADGLFGPEAPPQPASAGRTSSAQASSGASGRTESMRLIAPPLRPKSQRQPIRGRRGANDDRQRYRRRFRLGAQA